MLPLYDSFLLIGICALGAMTPGISLAVVTRHTLRGGHGAGIAAAVLHALGVGIWALATVTGLAVLLRSHPELEILFSLVGSLFLLWLAWASWHNAHQGLPETVEADLQVLHSAARDGFMVAFLNPKVALFFLALFSQFLRPEMATGPRIQMVITAMLVDGLWYALVAVMLGRSRMLPWLREHHALVERVTTVLLVLVAATVLLRLAGLLPGQG